MEERQATIDGVTYRLPGIFMVIATQNPIELQGTYPLPEAQLDRFFMRLSMGYPSPEQETEIMSMQSKEHPIYSVQPVLSGDELNSLQDSVSQVFLEKSVMDYIVKIVNATRTHDDLVLGASLRGSLSLMRASQATAVLRDMEYVEPSMVKTVAGPVLAHRIIVRPQAKLRGVTEEKIIGDILAAVPVPVT